MTNVLQPLVSIIIPTFGRADSLKLAIESVLSQKYENIEIVVVNDNKKNTIHYNSTNIMMEGYASNNNIIYLNDGINRGGGGARNFGVKNSTAEIITFLDDDDLYYENKIDEQLRHLLENNLDVSVCDMSMYKSGVEVFNKNSKSRVGSLSNFILDGNVFTPMLMLKKNKFIQVGGFSDTPRFQDHILMLKILGSNLLIGQIRSKLFIHNIHDGEGVTSVSNFEKGYFIRHNLEMEFISNLSSKQKREFYINHYNTLARIERNKGNLKLSFFYITKSVFLTRNILSLYKILKRTLGILIKRNSKD